ncbi:MAG: hypothetical protein BWY76_01181 [bacterium ADurb.Bin429]|nr:MAG: hypothetical protein BWY76_01181 [bacterium ADurb.Bin429]
MPLTSATSQGLFVTPQAKRFVAAGLFPTCTLARRSTPQCRPFVSNGPVHVFVSPGASAIVAVATGRVPVSPWPSSTVSAACAAAAPVFFTITVAVPVSPGL